MSNGNTTLSILFSIEQALSIALFSSKSSSQASNKSGLVVNVCLISLPCPSFLIFKSMIKNGLGLISILRLSSPVEWYTF